MKIFIYYFYYLKIIVMKFFFNKCDKIFFDFFIFARNYKKIIRNQADNINS